MELSPFLLEKLIRNALEEDLGTGDITTSFLIEKDSFSRGRIFTKEAGVLAGIEVARQVFELLESGVKAVPQKRDGDSITPGETLLHLEGPTAALLSGERVALNLLARLCGIATLTQRYVKALEGTGVRVADTRKTTPGLRALEKYAVRMGGGLNHRMGLYDAVMIKDNHIVAAGSIQKAVELVRGKIPLTAKIEVETESLEQVKEALSAGAEIIMLDNMDPESMKQAVALINKKALVEASGNITLENIRQVAGTGIDTISTSALIYRSTPLDLSLELLS